MPNAATKTENSILVSHWSKLIENFATDSTAFYVSVERALGSRQMPELKTSSVEWKEGGLFSAKREYLRVEWKRYILDICAAPFGTGFFFSSWLCMRAVRFSMAHLLGMLASVAAVIYLTFGRRWLAYWLLSTFGYNRLFLNPLATPVLLLVFLVCLLMILRAAKIGHRSSIEEFLLGMTIIGPIIDLFYRDLTYYELDTASMFQAASHAAVLEVVDQVTSAKGVRPLTDEERKPVMRDFFKK